MGSASSGMVPYMVAQAKGIDMKTIGNTLVATTTNNVVITDIVPIVTTAPSLLTTPAVVNIGTNSTNYNNMVAGLPMVGFFQVNSSYPKSLSEGISTGQFVAAGTSIFIRVATAAISTGAFAVDFDIIGYNRP